MIEIALAVLVVLAGVAWTELKDWLPLIARKLISRTVLNLSADIRERMEEEWQAELKEIPGKLSPFLFALSIWSNFSCGRIVRKLDIRLARAFIRSADLAVSTWVLVIALPVLIIVLVVTMIDCRRFGFARVRCFDHSGKSFGVYFFHTRHRLTRDRTRFGEFLWRAGLAHLPSFFNVIRGDMSVVGPRTKQGMPTVNSLKPGLFSFLLNDHELDDFGSRSGRTVIIYLVVFCKSIFRPFFIASP